jgi:urease accessory protein
VNAAAESASSGWQARLELEIVSDDGRSRLAHRLHKGPLRIQRPFYPEGECVLHLYLLHPPGGLVAGDELTISIDVRAGANAVFTTPAAQKIYRSEGATCTQTTTLRVASGASCEWLPSETLVFDGALSLQRTRLELATDAGCLAWDIGCFGRPASGLGFAYGRARQQFEVWRGAVPLLIERVEVQGGSPVLTSDSGYAGLPAYGTLVAVPAQPERLGDALSALRAELADAAGVRVGVTAFEGALLVRALGAHVEPVRRALERAFLFLRPRVLGRVARPLRIWAT